MKILKKISLILCSLVLFIGASFVLFGCGEDDETNQLYVFCSTGGYVLVEGQESRVENGDEGSRIFAIPDEQTIKLKAVADNGFKFSEWHYAEGLNERYEIFSHQAEINLISDEDVMVIKAIFTRVGEGTFGINYSTGNGYTVQLQNQTQTYVGQGGEVKFSVELSAEYNQSDIVVKNNGQVLTAVDGVYTISNVQADVHITVENVAKNKYTVGIPTGEGYTIRAVAGYDANNILHGNSFKFCVDLVSGYSEADFIISVGGNVLTPSGNTYTISNITSNCQITVSAATPETHIVSVTGATGVTVTPVASSFVVNSGANFQFTITANTGVNISAMVVTYSQEGGSITAITAVENVYTIENVQGDIQIQISGVSYTQKLISTSDTRFTIQPTNNSVCLVNYGSNFVFKIVPNTGYSITGSIVVKANGVTLTEANGQYTITNVTENQTITVDGGLTATKHTITLPTNSGCNITKTDGTNFTTNELANVQHGSTFSFKLAILDSHTGSCVVKAGITTLTANDGVYSFVVNGDTAITVSGLSLKQITITIPTVTGVQFKSVGGTLLGGNVEVEYGGEFKFTVVTTDSLISSCIVKVDGTQINAASGVYTISNITADKQITVDVTREMPYTVNTINPLRGASFVMGSRTGNLGEEFNFGVKVDSKYSFDQISVSTTAGTITKSNSVSNSDGSTTVNFVLNYSATGAYAQNVTLSVENVYFEYNFIVDYSELELTDTVYSDLPQVMTYKLGVNETLKTNYTLDEFKLYSNFGGSQLTFADSLLQIQEILAGEGSVITLGADFIVNDEVFVSINENEGIVTINWAAVSGMAAQYTMFATAA